MSSSYTICIVSTGSRGDVQPYCALGQALAAKGHDVTIATEDRLKSLVEGEFRLKFRRIHGDSCGGLQDPKFAKGIAEGSLFTLIKMTNEWKAKFNVDEILDSYVAALDGAEIIVTGGLCLTQSYCVAEKLSKSKGATVSWIPFILGPSMPTTEFPIWALARMACCKCMNRWTYNSLFKRMWNDEKKFINPWRERMGLPHMNVTSMIEPIYNFQSIKVLIGCSSVICGPKHQVPTDYDPQKVHVGGFLFVLPCPESAVPAVVREFLSRDPAAEPTSPLVARPIVYVGFGSMPSHNPLHLLQTAVDMCEALRVRAIVLAGWSQLTEDPACASLIEAQRGTLLVASSCPHDYLFPLVDCIVHHCGIGTTAAALRSGKPQVPCPVMLDQPHNAKMLHSLGVARDIVPYAKLNARNLTRAVGKVLANDKLVKEAAAKQGRFVREESEGNGARYVELIIKGHDEQRNDRGLGSAWGSLSQVGGALI